MPVPIDVNSDPPKNRQRHSSPKVVFEGNIFLLNYITVHSVLINESGFVKTIVIAMY